MRRGSVALVPLLIGMMLIFWVIGFMGTANDTLHSVNNVENLDRLQTKLLIPAMKYRYELSIADDTLTDAELDAQTEAYIQEVMVLNKIH